MEKLNHPVCPYCQQAMVRVHEHIRGGEWVVRWLCACTPNLRVVQALERKIKERKESTNG